MDDLQAPPSEPPGSETEPTSTPLKSKALNSPSSWTPELRPAERLLIRPAEARQRMERFPQGPDARAFRRRFFPAATPEQWNDWRWQLRNRIRSQAHLERVFELSARSEEHTSEIQSLMRISYAVFCLNNTTNRTQKTQQI